MIPLNDYSSAIKELSGAVKDICRYKEIWRNDDIVLSTLQEYYTSLYNQIHKVLASEITRDNERRIRELLARCVIG